MSTTEQAFREDARLLLSVEESTIVAADTVRLRGGFSARSGELVLIEVANLAQISAWADTIVGLLAPECGQVRFLDNTWTELEPGMRNELRSRIGRVFAYGNWLEQLSLLENILLPSLHHTDLSFEELRTGAGEMARALGLPGVPLGLPRAFNRTDQQRAACVRALLGNPLLVVLEEPTQSAAPELIVPLVNAMRALRARGSAVVWLTSLRELGQSGRLPANRRYELVGDRLAEWSHR